MQKIDPEIVALRKTGKKYVEISDQLDVPEWYIARVLKREGLTGPNAPSTGTRRPGPGRPPTGKQDGSGLPIGSGRDALTDGQANGSDPSPSSTGTPSADGSDPSPSSTGTPSGDGSPPSTSPSIDKTSTVTAKCTKCQAAMRGTLADFEEAGACPQCGEAF